MNIICSVTRVSKLLAYVLLLVSLNTSKAALVTRDWDVTSCKALAVKPDGSQTITEFIPKNSKVPSCFGWGLSSTVHPKYCPDWQNTVRSACKKAFDQETAQSSFSTFFKRLSSGLEPEIRFEGCIESYKPSGVAASLDWAAKKLADRLGSDAYKICTAPAQEEPKIQNATHSSHAQKNKKLELQPALLHSHEEYIKKERVL